MVYEVEIEDIVIFGPWLSMSLTPNWKQIFCMAETWEKHHCLVPLCGTKSLWWDQWQIQNLLEGNKREVAWSIIWHIFAEYCMNIFKNLLYGGSRSANGTFGLFFWISFSVKKLLLISRFLKKQYIVLQKYWFYKQTEVTVLRSIHTERK